MSYIAKSTRDNSDKYPTSSTGPGELNYVITSIIHCYLKSNYGVVNHTNLNEVIGVLELVKASLIETIVIPYKKQKMKINGCISTLDEPYAKTLS